MVKKYQWGALVYITQEGVNEHFSGAPKHSLGVTLHPFHMQLKWGVLINTPILTVWGLTVGFYGYYRGYSTINDSYFSGVAVLHGSPQQHIWSFIAGAVENDTSSHVKDLCPCDTSYDIPIPSYVGDDYFCETYNIFSFHSEDPLWDGDGCHSSSTCCTFNNPPYFTKYLDNPTTDDIEFRLCCHQPSFWENIVVELVEIYVK